MSCISFCSSIFFLAPSILAAIFPAAELDISTPMCCNMPLTGRSLEHPARIARLPLCNHRLQLADEPGIAQKLMMRRACTRLSGLAGDELPAWCRRDRSLAPAGVVIYLPGSLAAVDVC